MKKQTRQLKKAGWVVGNVGDFLGLSPYEEALVEIRLALGDEVRASRRKANLRARPEITYASRRRSIPPGSVARRLHTDGYARSSRLARWAPRRRVAHVISERALTQTDLAKLIHSSQSRVAKVEIGDATVSIDLQVKAILASGKNPSALFSSIARKLSNNKVRPIHSKVIST